MDNKKIASGLLRIAKELISNLPKTDANDIIISMKKDTKIKDYFSDYTIISEKENSEGNFDLFFKLEEFKTYDGRVPKEFMSIIKKWINKNKSKFNIIESDFSQTANEVEIELEVK